MLHSSANKQTIQRSYVTNSANGQKVQSHLLQSSTDKREIQSSYVTELYLWVENAKPIYDICFYECNALKRKTFDNV